MQVVFFKTLKFKYIIKVKIFKSQNGEIILKSSLNGQEVDLYELKNPDIANFKYHLASFEHYNIFGERWHSNQNRINLFFDSAIEYLYFENFGSSKSELVDFLQILDPSIKDMEYRALNSKKA